MLQKMVDFLEPLMTLTNTFGSDTVVTSSLVIPMLLTAKQRIDEKIKAAATLADERGSRSFNELNSISLNLTQLLFLAFDFPAASRGVRQCDGSLRTTST